MTTRVAINGFGRIGRLGLRAILERHRDRLSVVAINDIADLEVAAHLFKHDTNYGAFPGEVTVGEGVMEVDGAAISVTRELEPSRLPWKKLGVDVVIESTGAFTDAGAASAHLQAGARRAVITAPSANADMTVVLGVNDALYDPEKHHIVSNASCTTNCLAPVAKVLHDRFGIERGMMTTTHAYTGDQRILDVAHKDLRRARAAAMNIVPTSTGAARAIARVIPELEGKLRGMALRVPTATVSVVDLVSDLKRPGTADDVNAALAEAAEGPMNGILEYCEQPLVSSDFKGNTASSIVDGLSTVAVDESMVKVLSWYDNEWGYSCRVADLVAMMAEREAA
ncbi:MAG: type I glyceraldehyde-3-phosphate dehydrogenase [Deltaproteobacteria bacterium]|nr:type I glyceraldehyde-3-phosphate dehydrogenase [Deltaproteobacteria bacterium]